MTKPLGIYIHIPFCVSKCTYCNFYSFKCDEQLKDAYCKKLIGELKKWGAEVSRPVFSVYIGGGTPTALGDKRLSAVLDTVNNSFNVLQNAEITVEGNPGDDLEKIIPFIKKSGCNRFSLGLQSANMNELKTLGRRHTAEDAQRAVELIHKNGIENISVDLMLGLPESSNSSLKNSIAFALSLNVPHISAYILKLENGTLLSLKAEDLDIPDDDAVSNQYLLLCRELEKAGYEHYEISNFAKSNFHSHHNSAYWQCGEYLGFGPAAHSFYNGKRFYYPPDIDKYIENPEPIPDGIGGTAEEYIMLGLRLKSGISGTEFKNKFGYPLPDPIYQKAERLKQSGLCLMSGDNISLTDNGMLVSNSIINYFSEEINNENI